MDGDGTGSYRLVVKGSTEGGFVDSAPSEEAVSESRRQLPSREHIEDELDLMLQTIRGFWNSEPDQVMREVSAMSARLTELWVHLHRIESRDRTYKQIRTMQVNPMLEELDRQFRLASRTVEIRRQDLELMK